MYCLLNLISRVPHERPRMARCLTASRDTLVGISGRDYRVVEYSLSSDADLDRARLGGVLCTRFRLPLFLAFKCAVRTGSFAYASNHRVQAPIENRESATSERIHIAFRNRLACCRGSSEYLGCDELSPPADDFLDHQSRRPFLSDSGLRSTNFWSRR